MAEGSSGRSVVTLSQGIMGFIGLAITFLGIVLSQIGKRGDQAIQQNKDQFQRLIDEARYWKDNATEARTDLETFRDRQLNRCRAALDAAFAAITDMLRFVPPDKQREGTHALDEIEAHRDTDHS